MPVSLNLYMKEWHELQFQIIHIHDSLVPNESDKHAEDFHTIAQQLKEIAFQSQKIYINHYYVSFGTCDVCMGAYNKYVIKTYN